MNKLIGRTSHRLCTFSTSIREIKYYFNIWGIREKKKEGGSEKGGEGGGGWKFTHFTSPGSAPALFLSCKYLPKIEANIHILGFYYKTNQQFQYSENYRLVFFEKLIRRVWHQRCVFWALSFWDRTLFASQLGLDLEGVTFSICSSLELCHDYFIASLSCGSSFAFQLSSLLILGKWQFVQIIESFATYG